MTDEFGFPDDKIEVVMLIPHYGAPFDETIVFTNREKAMRYWQFLENRECVEFRELTFDSEMDAWYY